MRSLVDDNSNLEYYTQVGQKVPELNRYIAAHRLNWDLTDRLSIGASEAVVYGVRSIDLMYLLPFAPFLSLQQYLGDYDNIQWELDIHWKKLMNSIKRTRKLGNKRSGKWANTKKHRYS